jgi:GNAT superfamily N-acetyltransferase
MQVPIFRPARPDDQPELLGLMCRASLANPDDRQVLLARPEMIQLPAEQLTASTAAVALLGDAIAGFAVVLPRMDRDAELDGLFVEPAHWRCGIGRGLVHECVRLALAFGARRMHVIANPAAEGFYRRSGFAGDERVALQFGTGILMSRKLS